MGKGSRVQGGIFLLKEENFSKHTSFDAFSFDFHPKLGSYLLDVLYYLFTEFQYQYEKFLTLQEGVQRLHVVHGLTTPILL